jgi:hypothetical protein
VRRRGSPAPGGEPWRRGTFLSGQAVSLLADALTFLASLLSLFAVGRWRRAARAGWPALAASRPARWIGEIRLIVAAIVAAGAAIATMSVAGSSPSLMAANCARTWALVVASLVNRTQRQRIVPRAMLGRVTSGVRVLFLAVDPIGVVLAGPATSALGGDPRPVFLAAGAVIAVTAGAGRLAGLRRAAQDGGGARR